MAELVRYAKTKNVGILLWYNSNGWWNNAPQTPQDCMNTAPARKKEMKWMQEIGVKGIKVDFTRNAVGPMDFAPVFFNKRLSRTQEWGTTRRTTDAFELATGILYFSPILHFGFTPNNLQEQPDYVLDLIWEMPSVWDETVFIDGAPGKYIVLARRKADKWYVAAVNGEKDVQELTVSLPMLSGQEVSCICDNEDGTAAKKQVRIDKNGNVKIKLLAEGGTVLCSE